MKKNLKMTREQRQHAQIVLEQIAERYQMTPQEVLKPCKSQKNIEMKRQFWARLLWEVGLSSVWASRFAKRDHTTLIHAMRRMGEDDYGLPFRSSLEEIGAVWKAHNLAWREAA